MVSIIMKIMAIFKARYMTPSMTNSGRTATVAKKTNFVMAVYADVSIPTILEVSIVMGDRSGVAPFSKTE
jgi:hypothetical protein